jgi:hypothetical protein
MLSAARPRESGDPVLGPWIPAFAGMNGVSAERHIVFELTLRRYAGGLMLGAALCSIIDRAAQRR